MSVDNKVAADVQAAGSAFLAGTAWVADLNEWFTLAATIVAIIAGTSAAWYHIERAKELRRQRKIRAQKDD